MMSTKLPAALLALILSAAPALGAFCGVDCGAAAVLVADAGAAPSDTGAGHGHTHDAPPPGDAAPHDCHQASAGDVDVIGAGPQSCTHLRLDPGPAKMSTGDATALAKPGPPPSVISLADAGAPRARGATARRSDDHSAAPRAFVSPLRI